MFTLGGVLGRRTVNRLLRYLHDGERGVEFDNWWLLILLSRGEHSRLFEGSLRFMNDRSDFDFGFAALGGRTPVCVEDFVSCWLYIGFRFPCWFLVGNSPNASVVETFSTSNCLVFSDFFQN